ncbi:lysophospholipid acyltransferase family protein [Halovulum sp. GXIMD14793]
MLLIRSILFDIFIYGWMLLLGTVALPYALISRAHTYRVMKLYANSVLFLSRVMLGIRWEVRGPVPTGEVLIASKHQSFMDIMIHFKVLTQAQFVMKQELKWIPIFGFYTLRIGTTPVARGKRGVAVKDMVSHVEKERDGAKQLVIYPQGTRTAPGAKLPYKVGAGVIYKRMGLPCIPAATNVGVFWGRRAILKRPGLAVIEYLDTIEPGLDVDTFMTELETRVETASDRLMSEAGFTPPTDTA